MEKLYYLFFVLLFAGCGEGNSPLNAPSNVSNIAAKADTGAVVLSWDIPSDSSYLYLDITYDKYPDNPDTSEIIHTKASRHADSLVIDGLLNKYEYTFKIQPFNANPDDEVGGEVLTTEKVKPIRRPVDTVYYLDDLTEIEGITADMLNTYTQEESEGPKENLIDGDINTYWHSAWSSGVEPLPHWIEISFGEATTLGAMKYQFRQNGDSGGRPSQWALEVSEDGTSWERVWTSDEGLSVEPVDAEKQVDFGKNFTAPYVRIMILANPDNTTYTHLSEINLYKMKVEETDLEEQAEENY